MAITVTFSLDEKTVRMLGEIAGNGQRSEKLRQLIESEHNRIYRVVSVSELPHPADAEPVPVVEVAPMAEAPQ